MPLISRSIQRATDRVSLGWSMAVSPDRLWWGLTDADALAHWRGIPRSGSFLAGDCLSIEHADDYSCVSRILECEPEKMLGMTWKFPDEPLSQVLIELTEDGDGTGLLLMHDGLGGDAVNYLPG